MTTTDILSLIDAEIALLSQARAVLSGIDTPKKSERPNPVASLSTVQPKKKKRNLSPEGRARIAAAVKARWAKQKKAAKAS